MQVGTGRRLGVALVGLGGAVATTAVAGVAALRKGDNRRAGLPLADVDAEGLTDYRNLEFFGWDLDGADAAAAARTHGVLGRDELDALAPELSRVRPLPAIGSRDFCRNITGAHQQVARGHRDAVAAISSDLSGFRARPSIDNVVMVNLASTERWPADWDPLQSLDAFERGLDEDDPRIGPAMLYAYAAIESGVPYANFTPSLAADVPALVEFARRRRVPIAGKDGKTGQTMLKTVLAPALRARALHVDGWFSTNILGNRDGLALDDENSRQAKLATKASVLDSILGYPVEDHLVDIRYYRPRGDDKEAWDNIDVTGFLGQRMQIKINFLCKDSILAAPLVLEIARVLDLAQQRGEGGVQEQMSVFFKAPMVANGHGPEHAFHVQQQNLLSWLKKLN